MKKYQSSYVLKQIKKKRIFEKKIHMDFPYGFSIQLDKLFTLLPKPDVNVNGCCNRYTMQTDPGSIFLLHITVAVFLIKS